MRNDRWWPLPEWMGNASEIPLPARLVTLALPCHALGFFLAESQVAWEAKYFYDTDLGMEQPLRALHGSDAPLRLGPVQGACCLGSKTGTLLME